MGARTQGAALVRQISETYGDQQHEQIHRGWTLGSGGAAQRIGGLAKAVVEPEHSAAAPYCGFGFGSNYCCGRGCGYEMTDVRAAG